MNIYHQAMRHTNSSNWGTPRSATAELSDILQARGFTDDIIETWADSLVPGTAADVAEHAILWNTAGIPADDAVEYVLLRTGWTPGEAAMFQAATYKPRQAQFVDVLIRFNHLDFLDAGGQAPSTIDQWLTAPITPLWACLCLAAGLRTVEEALERQEQARHNKLTKIRLQWQAATRGLDVSLLTFEPIWFSGGFADDDLTAENLPDNGPDATS